jgi:hypothetical protein
LHTKGVIDKVADAAGITLPDAWKVNSSVNFSMLAMTGHLIFMLPDSELTTTLVRGRAIYSRSLEGAKGRQAIGVTGIDPFKEKMAAILHEWSERLTPADMDEMRNIVAAKFPTLVAGTPAAAATPASVSVMMAYLTSIMWYAIVILR